MSGRRLLGRLLTAALVIAAFVFLGLTIARNADEIRAFDWDVDPGLLVLSLIAHVLVLAWGVVIWHRILQHATSGRIGLLRLQRISFLSSIARYIPGKIWQFVAAAQMAGTAGIVPAAILTSLAIQIGFTLLAATLVSLATVPLPDSWPIGRPALLIAGTVAAVLLSHPAVLRSALRLLPRALHRDVVGWSGTWRESVALLALSVVSWLLYGAAFWLFVSALVDTPPSLLLPLSGVNALSFMAGYIVFFAPAGLGAREFAMTGLLGSVLPTYIGVTVAVLSRLWTIAAELLGAAVFVALGAALHKDRDRAG